MTTVRDEEQRAARGASAAGPPQAATPAPAAVRRRRLALAAGALALLVAYAAAFAWWSGLRRAEGWAGLIYHGPQVAEPEVAEVPFAGAFLGPVGAVAMVQPGSPADRAGITARDTVAAVAGVPIGDTEAIAALSRRLRRGDAVTYRLTGEDGGERQVQLTLGSPLANPRVLATVTVNGVVGLGFLAISLLVVRARPRSSPALVFYLLCTVGATFFFVLSVAELELSGSRGILSAEAQQGRALPFVVVYPLLAMGLANLLLHLILIFPRRRPLVERRPEVLTWLHTLPFLPVAAVPLLFVSAGLTDAAAMRWGIQAAAAAALLALLLHLRRRSRGGDGHRALLVSPWAVQGCVVAAAVLAGPLLRWLPDQMMVNTVVLSMLGLFYGYIVAAPLLYVGLTLVPLVRTYRESGVEEKRQLRWPLWGVSVALGLGSLVALVVLACAVVDLEAVTRSPWSVAALSAAKLLNLLIPASFAVAIVKYRLMDIDVILRKTAVYGLMSAFVVAGYLVLAGGVGMVLLTWTRIENQVVTIAATLMLAALFVPVRNRVQALVDRRFGRGGPDRAAALEQVRRQVVGSSDLGTLLGSMAETVQQALGSRTLVLFVQQPEERHLTARAKIGVPDEVVGRLPLSPAPFAVAGRVAEVDVLALDDDERERLRRLRTALVAPARRQGEVVGLVAAGRKLDGGDFGAEEREFLAAVADQLSLAIGTLGPRREELELDQARVLQRSLLPATLPEVPGVELARAFQPAREVAGDYYDVLDFGGGRAALCIGDVAGKGMAAALLMSSLQAAVRAVAAPEVAPARVCEQVRRVVCQSLDGGRFVTFFYALVDVPARRLAYCNAGHAPPLLAGAGGALRWLEQGGGAFARLLAESPLVTGDSALAAGDRLVLYTDGVTEARRGGGAMLGEEGLAAAVLAAEPPTAAATRERLLAAVAERSGPEAADDVTLLVARLAPPPEAGR
jgi:phosphoserine phosphatase RsbU/P